MAIRQNRSTTIDYETIEDTIRALCKRMADFELRQDEGELTTQNEVADYWMDAGAAYILESLMQVGYTQECKALLKLLDTKKKGYDYGLQE